MDYPRVFQNESSLTVEFAPETTVAKRQPLRMVLDYGSFGEILGIEIINLVLKAGENCLQAISQCVQTKGEGVRYSYDDESDSFYLRLSAGNSLDQKTVEGQVSLDDEGRIMAMRANWEEHE